MTAGYAPNEEGRLEEDAQLLDPTEQLADHRPVTAAVHALPGMLLQILHAGRYARHDRLVGPSPLPSPINNCIPRCMDESDIERTIEDFARTAELAIQAGYDGVELMGSEGYLLTQFCASRSNRREDRWGGTLEIAAVWRATSCGACARAGQEPLLAYRISALDLVPEGLSGEETAYLAQLVESAGGPRRASVGTSRRYRRSPDHGAARGLGDLLTAHLKAAVDIPCGGIEPHQRA